MPVLGGLAVILCIWALYAGQSRRTVLASIVGKSETVVSTAEDVLPTRWSRFILKASAAGEIYTLEPSAADFDALRPGDHLELMLVGQGPLTFARIKGSPEFVVPGRRLQGLVMFLARLADLVGILALVTWFFVRGWFRLWLSAAAIGAVALSLCALREEFHQRPASAVATLLEITSVTHTLLHKHDGDVDVPLPQPYLDLAFRFQPDVGRGLITAFDRIDGTTTGLKPGDRIDVRYDPADPRGARLVMGERSYLWKDLAYRGAKLIFEGVAEALALVAFCLILAHRKKREKG